MNHFEEELRQALRRKQPPEGFAERVVSRAASGSGRWRRLSVFFNPPALRWAAAAAAVVLLAGGVEFHQRRQERIQGERAKEQVLLALKITARELQVAQRKLQELHSPR